MTERVKCCTNAECRSTRIYCRTDNEGRYNSGPSDIVDWRCRECHETFETPDRKEKTRDQHFINGDAKTLAEMNPEDVPGLRE